MMVLFLAHGLLDDTSCRERYTRYQTMAPHPVGDSTDLMDSMRRAYSDLCFNPSAISAPGDLGAAYL